MLVSVISQLLRRLNSTVTYRSPNSALRRQHLLSEQHSLINYRRRFVSPNLWNCCNCEEWQIYWLTKWLGNVFPQLHHWCWWFARIFSRKLCLSKNTSKSTNIYVDTHVPAEESQPRPSRPNDGGHLPIYTQRWWLSVETNPSLTADDTNSAIIVILQSEECPHDIILEKESIFLRRYWRPPKPF